MGVEKGCRYAGGIACESGCFLIEQVKGQAAVGGEPAQQARPNTDDLHNGPYFTEEAWAELGERTLRVAEVSCAQPEDVQTVYKQVTEEKRGKGELYPGKWRIFGKSNQ